MGKACPGELGGGSSSEWVAHLAPAAPPLHPKIQQACKPHLGLFSGAAPLGRGGPPRGFPLGGPRRDVPVVGP